MELLSKYQVLRLLKLFETNFGQSPQKFPVHGFLKRITRGQLDHDVFVDSWPNFSAVVVKPNNEKVLLYRASVYCTDSRALKSMLCRPSFLPTTATIRLLGVPLQLVPVLEEVARHLHMHCSVVGKTDPRRLMIIGHFSGIVEIDTDMLKEFLSQRVNGIPSGYSVCDLDTEKHTESILNSWMDHNGPDFFANGEEARNAIKLYIKLRGSTGVIRNSDEALVAWVLSDIDTSSRIGLAMSEYRGHEIVQFVFAEHFRKMLEDSNHAWGYVPVNNIASRKKMEKFGAYFYEDDFVHCTLRPLQPFVFYQQWSCL